MFNNDIILNFGLGIDFLFRVNYIQIAPQRKEEKIIGIHKGTKLTDTPKNHSLNFRYDDKTGKKLDFLAKTRKTTKADVIRKGIEIQFDNENK